MERKINLENTLVYVLPHELYHDTLHKLKAARTCGQSLETSCELLIEDLKTLATQTAVSNLVAGGTYGYFGVSPFATADRDGKMIPNHGEIYLYSTTYQPKFGLSNGVLVSETGLGTIQAKPVKAGMLLVKL